MKKVVLLVVVAALLGIDVRRGASQEVADFQKRNDLLAAAISSGDKQAIGQFYTEDGLLMVTDQAQPNAGRSAIATYWANLKPSQISFTTEKVTLIQETATLKGWVIEEGTFQLTPQGGKTISGWRTVLWKPSSSQFQINEEQNSDRERCEKRADGTIVCTK